MSSRHQAQAVQGPLAVRLIDPGSINIFTDPEWFDYVFIALQNALVSLRVDIIT